MIYHNSYILSYVIRFRCLSKTGFTKSFPFIFSILSCRILIGRKKKPRYNSTKKKIIKNRTSKITKLNFCLFQTDAILCWKILAIIYLKWWWLHDEHFLPMTPVNCLHAQGWPFSKVVVQGPEGGEKSFHCCHPSK